MRSIRTYLVEIVAVSVIIILLLILANLFKYNYFSLLMFAQNKDAITTLTSIISTIILIISALATYYRFFRGRIFSTRVEIELKVSLHLINKETVLQAIEIEITNIGGFSIWEPSVSLSAYKHNLNGELSSPIAVNIWGSPSNEERQESVIVAHPQEKIHFYAFQKIPTKTTIVTYVTTVRIGKKTTLSKAITVPNVAGGLQKNTKA